MGVNIYVLSENCPDNLHVGWSASQSLEDTLKDIFNPVFLYPTQNQTIGLGSFKVSDRYLSVVRRYRHRLFRSWYDLESLPSLGVGPNVLLVIGFGPHFLLSMHALGPLLSRFDLRIGYLLDGFSASHLNHAAVSYLDHLFVISQDRADAVRASHRLDTTFLPLATNTLNLDLNRQHRWIDVLSYGRRDESLHKQLSQQFCQLRSDRFYFYSTFAKPDLLDRTEHVMLQSKLLNHAKISLCFEVSQVARFYNDSPLLYRWIEGWVHGCTIVGRRPLGKNVDRLMDWENSAIDLPDDDANQIEFLESLLADPERLSQNGVRNHRECLLRHDWRYRLRDILTTVNLPIPDQLTWEIQALQDKVKRLSEESHLPIYI